MVLRNLGVLNQVLAIGAVLALIVAPVARATTVNRAEADCSGLELKAASGVPDGAVRQYAFKGICKSFINHIKDGESSSKTPVATYWTEAKAEWDEQKSTITERVSLKNPQTSESWDVVTIMKCTKDPIIHKPSCLLVKHQNETKWDGFSNAALEQKRPILSGKTTLAAATALSKQAPPPPAAKTPPPPPKTLHKPTAQAGGASATATLLNIEAEDLVKAGKTLVNGGKLAVQPMAGFGSGWSGNAQLFWSGGRVGAVLDLIVDVPAAATYAVELYVTRAPDYADLKMEIDGKPATLTIQGFAPNVMAPIPLQVGKFSLAAGQRKISFMITGKYPKSTNYFVGIDRVRLYPAGGP